MTRSPSSNIDVKRRNRSNTLRCILASERVSQMELTQRLALSWPTILQNVKELMALGLVREDGVYGSTGGRRAKAYAPVRDAKMAVGVDLTQDHISIVLTDLNGTLLHQTRSTLRFAWEEAYMRYLGDLVQRFAEVNDAADRILGVGISLPGIVDEKRGLLRDSHILGVRNVPLEQFGMRIPWLCQFVNDANAAGLAEVYGRSDTGDLVYLSLSDSVGGAILRDGDLYMGDRLRAGEFGHNTLVPGGRRCYCGKDGCLDAYCSAKRLSDRAGGSLSAFFKGLQAGDPEKRDAWREYLEYLAVAVNNLHTSFDCDVVVGGSVGGYLKDFGELLRALLAERNTFGPDASYLKDCRRPQEASAAGAALMWVEDYLRSL